ncbi:MFS transporter, partial [Methylobacterium sp. WL122]
AAFSATFAGLIIVSAGYSAAFLALAATAGLGFVLYLTLMPETRDEAAVGGGSDGGMSSAMPATA